VFVGSNIKTYFAFDRKDEYRSPYTGRNFIPGVEVQVTEFLNLLRRDWLTRSTFVQEKWLVLLAGLLFGIGLASFRPTRATWIALLAVVVVTWLAHYLFWHHRFWFPWLIFVMVQIPIALLWSILYNSLSAYVQNKLLEQSLGLYLSPKQVQRILKEPGLRQPGGSKQVVSILFSDIAGFSRISEQLDPQELVQLLNAYYETTIRCIHKTDGTIVDIIGDAIFAIWNAPELQPDHQEKMLQAALAFQQNVTNFNGKAGSLALRTRVGLHTGEVVVGNVGSTEHFDFTAIGENVNLASRLEGLNKQLGTDVLLTPAALPTATEKYSLRPVGKFQFKGFEHYVAVIELVVNVGTPEQSKPWRDSFASALAEFGRKNFDAAETSFKRTLELRPADGPSNFYLKQIVDLRTHALPENWAGEISLKEK
jgi:adenylate cyclase